MRRLVIRPFIYIPLVASSAFNPLSFIPTARSTAQQQQQQQHATGFHSYTG
jgi:hypothetical protein